MSSTTARERHDQPDQPSDLDSEFPIVILREEELKKRLSDAGIYGQNAAVDQVWNDVIDYLTDRDRRDRTDPLGFNTGFMIAVNEATSTGRDPIAVAAVFGSAFAFYDVAIEDPLQAAQAKEIFSQARESVARQRERRDDAMS